MIAENVEFVRRFFEDLNEGNVEALLARLTPEFEMVVPAGMGVEPRTYRGPEGFRRWFDSFSEIMEVRVESHDFIAVGDRVVAPHTLHARVTRGDLGRRCGPTSSALRTSAAGRCRSGRNAERNPDALPDHRSVRRPAG